MIDGKFAFPKKSATGSPLWVAPPQEETFHREALMIENEPETKRSFMKEVPRMIPFNPVAAFKSFRGSTIEKGKLVAFTWRIVALRSKMSRAIYEESLDKSITGAPNERNDNIFDGSFPGDLVPATLFVLRR
jgi:hypothetical protein